VVWRGWVKVRLYASLHPQKNTMLSWIGGLLTKARSVDTSVGLILFALIVGSPALSSAQSDARLQEIRAKIQDHRRLAREHGSISVAEITKMEAIPRSACKSGIEHRITYRLVENLWVEPDSRLEPGYIITKGFVDCRERQRPSPAFSVGAKVLIYCGRLDGYNCLPPALATAQNADELRSWLDALRRSEGDAALLQVHESLLESSEILSRVPAGRPVVIQGELGWPFLFTGQVKSI
jgi:hypothetical protein